MNQNNDSKPPFLTVLVFPPQWTPQNPHFAITQLLGYLRKNGCQVGVKDLNAEFYDRVLTPEYIQFSINKAMMSFNFLITQARLRALMNDQSLDAQIEAKRLLEIDRFFSENAQLVEKLPGLIMDARETLKDSRRFYNPMLLVDAFYAIDKALELVSLPYHPSRLSFNNFDQPHMLMATEHIIQHASDKRVNLFYDFMEEKAQEILEQNPGLIGISINSFSQVLPGLTLARMLRKSAPDGVTVSIGGNFFGRIKETLMKRPEFFENFCHCLSMGEGEKQTLIMIEELSAGNGFGGVPNILYYEPPAEDEEKGRVIATAPGKPEKLDGVSCQDLEGLPLDLYFTPEIVLCLQSSKGCYWGKCTFCDTDFGIRTDVKSLDRLIEEIRHVKDKFGIRHFEFIDESIKPSYMKAFAQRLIDEKLDIHWFSNGRLEQDFSSELLSLLKKSGLTLILWGYESGSRRILDLINKGIDIDSRHRILKESSDAGIWNFAYIFFGFPTETKGEARETIQSLVGNKDIIDSYGRSVFTLGKHSLLFLEKEKYGIFNIVEDPEELSTNISYSTDTGMTDEEIDEMMKECTRTCAEAYDYNLWYYLRYRENIHLYLSRYGRDYVRGYKVQQELSARTQTW